MSFIDATLGVKVESEEKFNVTPAVATVKYKAEQKLQFVNFATRKATLSLA